MASNSRELISADDVLDLLRKGNERFVRNQPAGRDFNAQRSRLVGGQSPCAAIVSCIDSRVAAELIFDLDLGQVFHTRMAAACATTELIAGLEYAAVSGVALVVVMGHTGCGAVNAAVARRAGAEKISDNLEGLLEGLYPAIDRVPDFPGEKSAENPSFVNAVARASVLETVSGIRRASPLLADHEKKGLKIQGAMYDLKTGVVEFLSPA